MTSRAAARVAWAAWALTVGFVGLMALFMVLGAAARVPGAGVRPIDISFSVALLAFATVGAALIACRPGNALGWMFSGLGLAMAVAGFARPYAIYALLAAPGVLPAAELLAWTHVMVALLAVGVAAVFILLMFPNGRLPSRRWRSVAWLSCAGVALMAVALALQPGPIELGDLTFVHNPFGVEGAADRLHGLERVGLGLLATGVLASAASMILRLTASRGIERLQLKWMAYAAAVMGLMILFAVGVYLGFGPRVATNVAGPLAGAALAGMPVAAGIAILRHRLYDIDVLIRRTLVYGVLTAGLGLLYWGSVVLLQPVLRPFTEGSELAVMASTLAVAALFQPARRRIQDLVDRRFYRRKYDAQQALQAFSARLRRETELDSLRLETLALVRDTVQPAHVSLWLPAANGERRSLDDTRSRSA
jgi:hypothetical protein